MTALVARTPLHTLSMSAMQSGSRRLSARLQEKENSHPSANGMLKSDGATRSGAKVQSSSSSGAKKRKNDYEEDDDGFTFTRVKKAKKPRVSTIHASAATEPAIPPSSSADKGTVTAEISEVLREESTVKKKRKRISFSTPDAKEPRPVRRSKRVSSEATKTSETPVAKLNQEEQKSSTEITRNVTSKPSGDKSTSNPEEAEKDGSDNYAAVTEQSTDPDHSATKIALPFADTPVIQRNKAMRKDRNSKGVRRSSLGFRGRRASSLIDTGNSNALPHQEVGIDDFYKHIESDLIEPRRMRQLLTWCATRAMHAKPKGTDFEDASAKSAARVIEEELLKELSNKSELSDWLGRENTFPPPVPIPERPNPKNIQNKQKITELEEQIKRLRSEKQALESLLRPPKLDEIDYSTTRSEEIDQGLLSDSDAALLRELNSSSGLQLQIASRVNSLSKSLGPTIDQFADGVHKMAQYRDAADNIAGRVLSICAERLEEREREGRKRALGVEESRSPARDLSSVLRGLTRIDR